MCSSSCDIHSKTGRADEPIIFLLLKKRHWSFRTDHQERECIVVDWEEGWCWFSFILANVWISERISKQQLFATNHNDVVVRIKPSEGSRKLPIGSGQWAAHMQNWPSKPWRGQMTQEMWRKNSFAEFFGFSRLFPGFAGPWSTADGRCALHIDAQRRQ